MGRLRPPPPDQAVRVRLTWWFDCHHVRWGAAEAGRGEAASCDGSTDHALRLDRAVTWCSSRRYTLQET